MSDIYKKAAALSPVETFLLSIAGGAGGYAGLATLQNALTRINHKHPKENEVQLALQDSTRPTAEPMGMSSPATDVAGAHPPQISKVGNAGVEDPTSWSNWGLTPYLAMAAGVPVGFLGAKKIYDAHQDNQMQKQVDAKRKEYELALQQIQQGNKIASETPCVDGFCEELAKHAWLDEVLNAPVNALTYVGNKTFQTTPGLFGSAKPPAGSGESTASLFNKAVADPRVMATADEQTKALSSKGLSNIGNFFTGNALNSAQKAWLALAGVTSAGALAAGIHAQNKKKEREEKALYPTAVSYAR